jgi:hypothetical protein
VRNHALEISSRGYYEGFLNLLEHTYLMLIMWGQPFRDRKELRLSHLRQRELKQISVRRVAPVIIVAVAGGKNVGWKEKEAKESAVKLIETPNGSEAQRSHV